MLTTRSAHRLLAGAMTLEGQQALADALGFGPLEPLDADVARALCIPEEFADLRVARGPRTLRLLAARSPDAIRPERLQSLAARLSLHGAHVLWLTVLSAPAAPAVAVVAWQPTADGVRVAALHATRTILESDAETLAALAAARGPNDLLVHQRWTEILGRESVSRRFYVALRDRIERLALGGEGPATPDERLELALTCASRLLFLAFLETRGWLDGDHGFLARHLDRVLGAGGAVHRRLLDPLFFGTLNTPLARRAPAARAFGRVPFLNGGLFQRTPMEARRRTLRFRDADLAELVQDVLLRFRFTAVERGALGFDAAVDPEMLGRTFESLMASADRRASGTFYTPHALVERATEAALRDCLTARGVASRLIDALVDRIAAGSGLPRPLPAGEGRQAVLTTLRALRVVDPACGSGAFLVRVLEHLSALQAACGDARPEAARRADLVTRTLFGVDVNPVAVWLCELRLWLAVILPCEAADPLQLPALPNLDHNIRVGDALAGGGLHEHPAGGASLRGLRLRYSRARGARKRTLARQLQRSEMARALDVVRAQRQAVAAARRDLLQVARSPDLFGRRRGLSAAEGESLATLRLRARELQQAEGTLRRGSGVPFAFATHFPDAAADGGFDLVIGNPPWVRLHHIPVAARERFRVTFDVFRHAAWERGAEDARAGRGFASQVDLAALFAERAVSLTRDGGSVALLLPAKLWRSLAGGGVRRLLGERYALRVLEDWSDAPPTFDAAVYPSLVVVRRMARTVGDTVTVTTHRRDLAIAWTAPRAAVSLDDSPGAPWLLLPPDALAAFARLHARGLPLIESGLGRPMLGVKCGCNDAFLLQARERRGDAWVVAAGERTALVESVVVRPALRGEQVQAWRPPRATDALLCPHAANGAPFAALPPLARQWLLPWRRRLLARADLRGAAGTWWQLFRMEASLTDRARVVWADFGRRPTALVLEPGDPTVPLNTCYVQRCRDLTDAWAIAALFNSDIAAAALGAVAEPARGGFRRYMAWAVARLPLPRDWAHARALLAPLGARAGAGERVGRGELLEATTAAFRLRPSALAPLLEWVSEPAASG